MLAVASEDVEAAARVVNRQWGSELSDTERNSAGLTVDLDAEETTCPACMATFRPADAEGRCPDCGLALA